MAKNAPASLATSLEDSDAAEVIGDEYARMIDPEVDEEDNADDRRAARLPAMRTRDAPARGPMHM